MKEVLFSLSLVAGLAGAARAQEVKFGLKAGSSLTTITGRDAGGASAKLGFHAGVAVKVGLGSKLSIQPEALYSMKGARSTAADSRINFNYIDVPVLLKFSPQPTGFFLEVGPQLGFLADVSLQDNTGTYSGDDFYNKFDFGYVAGVGFQLQNQVLLGLRYNGGLTTVSPSDALLPQYDIRNSAIQLYVGYLISKK